ncbi:MAG: 3-phosphoshikimate 1-carboxyvinyltransferase [Candidatus Peribacter sp.]|jgi:3-phosphoshikimate 1-carboxyvinyltransferase
MRRNFQSVAPLKLPFDVELTMPGSKSHANRAIIAACLSSGKTTIRNATACDDVNLLVKNLQNMGFDIGYAERKTGTLIVNGGIPKLQGKRSKKLYCGNAGTTLRFLTALACITPGSFVITGDEAMQKRPIHDLVEALQALGAYINDTNGCPPVTVGRGKIHGGRIMLESQKSSQYLSALLLIAPATRGLSIELSSSLPSQSYVHLTQRVMRDFGVMVHKRKGTFSVPKHSAYRIPTTYDIEGDHSAAGAFFVLAELTESNVRFSNLHRSSEQGDAVLPKVIIRMRKRGDIVIDCANIPDQVMNLAVLAAFRSGQTILTGIANLRYKECDRISVLTHELHKAGIEIRERNDDLIVQGGTHARAAVLDPHNDHRMAFCFAVLGSIHRGIRIKDPACVSKSYPQFFGDLAKLHHSSKPIALIGMRGVGKSTLGKQLASSLGLEHIDSDTVFERKHGNIQTYVQKKGWMKFREEEEWIIAECLQPRSVLSLGGGAVESAKTRRLLRSRSIAIHLQGSASSILARLKKDQRPSLTSLSLEQEVPLIMKRRAPLFQNAAHISLKEPHGIQSAIQSLQALCSL